LLHHIIIAALMTAFVAAIATAAAQNSDWSSYLRGPQHSSYNKLATAITPANASTLVEDWRFIDPGPTIEGQPDAGFYASPTVVNGVVYIGSNTGVFYALDEATGVVLWRKLLGYTTRLSCSMGRGIVSTAAVATDPVSGTLTVYVGGGDGYLYALNAATGRIRWRQFVVDIGTTQNEGFIFSSPTIVNGRIYLGVSSQCDNPLVRGAIKAFDMHTGALLETYWTTPSGTVGAGVWTSAASDGRSVWITTGNGNAGHSFAIIRLDTALRFHTEWVDPGAFDDLDWGSSPTLFEARLNNMRTQMIGANQKSGIFYAFDATHLENGPVWMFQVGTTQDFSIGACLAAPVWDSTHRRLLVGSNQTTIQSQTFAGSMRSFDPATGSVIWETGLTGGPVMGSPTLNGAGVLAAGTYNIADVTQNAVYLLDASNGNILTSMAETTLVFSQPVFADTHLFVATAGGVTSEGILTAFTPSALKPSPK
jgi:polyvinyl alcohol dehydrogenase (cytochrome)